MPAVRGTCDGHRAALTDELADVGFQRLRGGGERLLAHLAGCCERHRADVRCAAAADGSDTARELARIGWPDCYLPGSDTELIRDDLRHDRGVPFP